MRYRQLGFSLLELAIVIFILGALLGAALTPLQIQFQMRAIRQTQAALDDTVAALYGFAVTERRLPCPDLLVGGDGREDRLGPDACVFAEGGVPHVDLAISGVDAWGHRLRYRVTAAETTPATGANFVAVDDGVCQSGDGDFDLCAIGAIRVVTRGDDPATISLESKHQHQLADQLPAVVISHGPNGRAAVAMSAADLRDRPAPETDEAENADGDAVFVSRRNAAAQVACGDDEDETAPLCEFDDLVTWLSPAILNHLMVISGQLP